MKRINQILFPILLIVDCFIVHYWQHGIASLPYLPKNQIVPLAVWTPLLLIATYFAAFTLLKGTNAKKPALRAMFALLAMPVPVIIAGMVFLSYAARRYAGILPVLVLPDLPGGIMTMIVTALCIAHLTGLLVYSFVKQKPSTKRIVLSSVGWALLNLLLWLVTT